MKRRYIPIGIFGYFLSMLLPVSLHNCYIRKTMGAGFRNIVFGLFSGAKQKHQCFHFANVGWRPSCWNIVFGLFSGAKQKQCFCFANVGAQYCTDCLHCVGIKIFLWSGNCVQKNFFKRVKYEMCVFVVISRTKAKQKKICRVCACYVGIRYQINT